MSSNVGSHNIYEAGDQRNYAQSELNTGAERFHEGQIHSHQALDSSTLHSFWLFANEIQMLTTPRNRG